MFWVQNSYWSKRIKQRVLMAKQNKANQAKREGDAPVSLGCEKWGAEHSGIVTSLLGLGNLILFVVIQLMKKILFRNLIEVTALLNNTTSPPEKKGNYHQMMRRALWLQKEVSRACRVAGRERKADQLFFFFFFSTWGCFYVLFVRCQLVDVGTRPWQVTMLLKVCSSERRRSV